MRDYELHLFKHTGPHAGLRIPMRDYERLRWNWAVMPVVLRIPMRDYEIIITHRRHNL